MRKYLVTLVILIVGNLVIGPTILMDVSSADVTVGSTLYVGSGQTYTTIQSAVNAASENDVIVIHNGTYYENVLVNKTLIIVGNGTANTIIDGGGSANAMKITADNCRVYGIAFTGSGEEDWENGHAGLWIESEHNWIQNCSAYDNYFGFQLRGDSNTFSYCEAYENDIHGFGLWRYSETYGCHAHNNTLDGFWMFVAPYSYVERCISVDNGADGISIDHTEDVYVTELLAVNNSGYGISIGGGGVGYGNTVIFCIAQENSRGGIEMSNAEGPNFILNNTIRDNDNCGINLTRGIFGTGTFIDGNLIENNTDYGVRISDDCIVVKVERNDLIDNQHGSGKQGYDANTENSWDNGVFGNYWNDWTTPDSNSDKVVDLPYQLDGGSSEKDNYPLTYSVSSSPSDLSWDLWDRGTYHIVPDGVPFYGDDSSGASGDEPDDNSTSEEPDDNSTSEEPDDNSTTEEPDDNSTSEEPDDNSTTEEPDDNSTSEEPDDNSTTEEPDDNSTDDDKPQVLSPEIIIQEEPYEEGGPQHFSVPYELVGSGEYAYFEWYIVGYGRVGEGENVDLDLPAGTYRLTLIGRNSNNKITFEVSREIQILAGQGSNESDENFLLDNLPVLMIVILSILLIAIAFSFILGKRRKDRKEQHEMPTVILGAPADGRIGRGPALESPASIGPNIVISGSLQERYRGELDKDASKDPISLEDYDQLFQATYIINNAMKEATSTDVTGSATHRVKKKLEHQYSEGKINRETYQELNGMLSEHM